jgi:hypothetical protein
MKKDNNILQFCNLIIIHFIILACARTDAIPDQILDFKLTKTLSGEEAKILVDKIHFNEVAPDNNRIGFYSNSTHQSTIYVTFYANSDIAQKEWKRMTDKISPENSVFIMASVFKHDGKDVYRCFGMGQTHFVFSFESMLIWISTETTKANSFLNAYIKHLY